VGAISGVWIVALALLLASCGREPPRYQGIDVTGADWGRDYSLRDYTLAFDPGFLGLYGDAAETGSVTKEFKVFYEKVPTDGTYTVNHAALSYVFDPSGRLRLVERHTLGADAVAADLRKLMRKSF